MKSLQPSCDIQWPHGSASHKVHGMSSSNVTGQDSSCAHRGTSSLRQVSKRSTRQNVACSYGVYSRMARQLAAWADRPQQSLQLRVLSAAYSNVWNTCGEFYWRFVQLLPCQSTAPLAFDHPTSYAAAATYNLPLFDKLYQPCLTPSAEITI